MKAFLIVFLISSFDAIRAQSVPQFEQIAFDYYLDNLVEENLNGSVCLKLRSYSESNSWFPSCHGDFRLEHLSIIKTNNSGISNLSIASKGVRLKSKPYQRGRYPRISVTTSYSTRENQHIVNILVEYRHYGNVYYVEMNQKGLVVNTCTDGWIKSSY